MEDNVELKKSVCLSRHGLRDDHSPAVTDLLYTLVKRTCPVTTWLSGPTRVLVERPVTTALSP